MKQRIIESLKSTRNALGYATWFVSAVFVGSVLAIALIVAIPLRRLCDLAIKGVDYAVAKFDEVWGVNEP